ncbi:MAG: 16S rRNA (adenine(1518)-N(6)/adenine(1519)-N(6))-dimethyltransferase RsmA [Patescibacteria group bacterium]|nr:16S rRNA (adenine(1518)-N(6)/adenine(1519)-N(6))-dimethyltransferase RsmA [Patescibacteria group bacterium]
MHPRARYGQCFLIDLNLLDILADAAELTADDVVLEVGTGTGSLTQLLAQRAAAVVTVEIDQQLFQLASEELYTLANVTMLQLDALKTKNRLNPVVLDAVFEQVDDGFDRRFQLAANLPYNVATPIISNLLALDRAPHAMTVTIQKELADRLTARPGTKDYGALSIWVQSQCTAEVVRILPPTAFWPRPKVESAIVRIVVDSARRDAIPDRAFFHEFVRALFCHRRKFLRSELLTCFKGRLDKPRVDAILESLALSPQARAEQLDVPAVLRLCDACRGAVQSE